MDNKALWSVNRRKFIKGLVAAGIMTKMGFLESCTRDPQNELLNNAFFSENEMTNLSAIVNRLFPDDGNGPSCSDINAVAHIIWTLQNTEFGFNSFEMLKSAFEKLNKYTKEEYAKTFSDLAEAEQISTLETISKDRWGERFLSNILTYIFEALAIDPLYNVNKNQLGWEWLGHQAGLPRPNESQLYPEFLKRYNDEV